MQVNSSDSVPSHNFTGVTSSTSCCSGKEKKDPLLTKIDTLCRLTIGVIGAIIAPIYLFVSLSVGTILGASYAAVRIYQGKTLFPEGESKPICAQGYMDFLSGMRFSPVMGTLATTAFIVAHMRHDAKFYVPFCGLFLGFWIGREAVVLVINK